MIYSICTYVASGSLKEPGDEGCWWNISRPTLDSQYADVDFPYASSISRWCLPEKKSMPVSSFIGYIETMSAYRMLLTKMKDGDEDPKFKLRDELLRSLGTKDMETMMDVEFPFFVISCTKSY